MTPAQKHIPPALLTALYHRRIPAEEALPLRRHLADCDDCALAFARIAEAAPLPVPPALAESLRAALQPPQAREKTVQRQFWLFAAKAAVGMAACCAMLFIPLPSRQPSPQAAPLQSVFSFERFAAPALPWLDNISKAVNDFSQTLLIPNYSPKEDTNHAASQKK